MSIGDQLALAIPSNATTSYEGLLESQKELISKQINELKNIVSKQCKLTGVNPLSQEMAAGALSIKIGKRPRDLLNPKAIKYMQSIFSVKDEISKKEIRAISALFGLTATQVRDFFTGQKSRVRRFIRLSREKAIQSAENIQAQDEPTSSNNNKDVNNQPVPLNSVGPPSIEEAPSCSTQDEVMPDTNDSDKYFIENIFGLLRKEETFSGQVKLMEWILQIQNPSVLYWFLTNGGVMILATWLSEAALEEQTSVLHMILRVLCHLPLHKSLPAHMSAILQSVNKLRFYRGSDISNRAKNLLSRWSKMFARSQAMRKPNANISPVDAQNQMLLKQSIGEIMENESLESRIDNPDPVHLLQQNSENSRNLGSSPPIKLLTGVAGSHTRERRKVQLVEQPGQKPTGRGPQVTRVVPATQGRPLSADDIQKAKMRAQFMRSKYGESYVGPKPKPEVVIRAATTQGKTEVVRAGSSTHRAASSSTSLAATMVGPPPLKAPVHPRIEEQGSCGGAQSSQSTGKPHGQPKAEIVVSGNMELEEPVWKKCKRFQISWVNPPEMKINKEWSVCFGENSKEIDVQNNRIKREKEVFYNSILEIPQNPKEPWDQEMDYDDSLTLQIPTEQPPDDDESEPLETLVSSAPENSNPSMPPPDLELLAVLLKNPQIVFALTAGQGGSLTDEQLVKLLDAIKENAARGGSVASLVNGLVGPKSEEKVEVSLPSPTPSSNPVTNGWRPESSKNQNFRQSVTVNGDIYSIPGVHFQEPQQVFNPINHYQRFPDIVPEQQNVSNLAPEQRNLPNLVPDRRNISPFQGTTNSFNHQTNSPVMNQRFSGDIPVTGHGGAYYGSHRQAITEPRQPWSGRESLGPGPYGPTDRNMNHNSYGSRDFAQPSSSLRAGPTWARNGPGFESWSPDDSPVRSHEYGEGWDPHNRNNYNYRSGMQHDQSRYGGDRGGRNDGSRWRDRRR